MTNQEILYDALEYYTVDPVGRRCVKTEAGSNYCYYSPKTIGKEETSEGCLIGRLLEPEMAEMIDRKENEIGIDNLIRSGEYSLPSFMNETNSSFLESCQFLHDQNSNWEDTGLSERGKEKVLSIIKNYNLDKELFSKFLN